VKRTESEHAIRAAAAVLEVDVAALDDPEGRKADLIDGAFGEASMFHATFGYYAQGVEPVTAALPNGWKGRLARFETEATRGVTAWCLEPHDLWIAKMIANRPKDLEFGRAILKIGIVEGSELLQRLDHMDMAEPVRRRIERKIEAWSDA